MGAWGTGPTDNDTAGDFFADLSGKPIPEIIDHGLNSDSPEKLRAAAWMLKQIGISHVYPLDTGHFRTAIKRLNGLLHNDEWLASWNEPQEVVDDIRLTIATLTERVCLDEGC